jgi:hypothetical protein
LFSSTQTVGEFRAQIKLVGCLFYSNKTISVEHYNHSGQYSSKMSTAQVAPSTPFVWEFNERQVGDYRQYFQTFDGDKDGFIQGNL